MPSPRPPMTKTVVKKVSPNVKVLRPGSKILTQTNSEKKAMIEKAKTKTPSAKSADAARAANAKANAARDSRYLKGQYLKNKYLEAAGYKPGQGSNTLTPAQMKAGNLAVAEEQRKMKAQKLAAKAAKVNAPKIRGGSGIRGGLGIGGLRGNVNR